MRRFVVALRCGGVAAACLAAAVGEGTGISRAWQASVLGCLVLWAAAFSYMALRWSVNFPLVAGDTAAVSLALLAQQRYIPEQAVIDETTWALMLASTAIYVAQIALRPATGLPLAAIVIGAYVVGAPAVSSELRVLIAQSLAVSAIMELLRHAGRRADALVAERDRERLRATVMAARRADERDHRAQLHDSVLATLTMVASGAMPSGSPTLRTAAERALAVMRNQDVQSLAHNGAQVDLAERLAEVVRSSPATLRVTVDVTRIEVPATVAQAIAEAVGEALRNVALHARTNTATVRARHAEGAVVVEVVDRGAGFDPVRVPDTRQGIRESIADRMAAAGGAAQVHSAPRRGTRVVLRWPDG